MIADYKRQVHSILTRKPPPDGKNDAEIIAKYQEMLNKVAEKSLEDLKSGNIP